MDDELTTAIGVQQTVRRIVVDSERRNGTEQVLAECARLIDAFDSGIVPMQVLAGATADEMESIGTFCQLPARRRAWYTRCLAGQLRQATVDVQEARRSARRSARSGPPTQQ